jgi:pimeloyl-ACP methyl ester carboxylesterase
MRETEIKAVRGDRVLLVRDAGDPAGAVVLYFHGTPGSRLDVSFGDEIAADRHVRLVSFDRPGYGGSTPAPFGLAEVAADGLAIADELGVSRFATLGFSGGGPFALATAALGGERVAGVGVASGAGPFQQMPGALDILDDNDTAAAALLPTDPAAAAAGFAAGFEPLVELSRAGDAAAVVSALKGTMSARDQQLLTDPRFAAVFGDTVREGLRQGPEGGGWDNVAWIGPWGIDLGAVSCPVLLWYGSEDRAAPVAYGQWQASNIPHATLVINDGDGHMGIYDHLAEMLTALTQPEPAS